MTVKTRILTLITVALFTTAAAHGENGPYIGASAGQTRVELSPGDVGEAGFRIDDEDFAYKLFLGYRLPGPLAFEGGFRDLGRVTDDDGLVRATSESDAFDVFVLGSIAVGPVSIFAKGGIVAWDTEFERRSADGLGLPDIRLSDSGTDLAWGIGVSGRLGRFGLRGEFERLEVDLPDDLTMLTVGVTIDF